MRSRISNKRLMYAERNAPPTKTPPVTVVRTIVATNAFGERETIGVGFIKRTRRDGSLLTVRIDPPRRDLLELDLCALSDAEIEALK